MLPRRAMDEPGDYFGPHALEAVAHGGARWTIDGRIGEFRRCDRPWINVPFDSAHGRAMIVDLDVTICDLVADLRAPTPSAGAEAVAPDATTVLEGLRRIPARLGRGLIAVSARRRERLEARSSRLTRAMELRLAPPKQSLDLVLGRLERVIRGLLDARARTLTASSARLAALSPLATLQRGYAVARRDDGSVIRSVRGFPTDAPFTLRVSDGTVSATLEGILDEEPP